MKSGAKHNRIYARQPSPFILATLTTATVAVIAPAFAQTEDEEEMLRERLTERVDRRRPPEPNSVDIAGRPLTVTGEFELEFDYLRDAALLPIPGPQLSLKQGPEIELFYTFGPVFDLARIRRTPP